jgi:hypothetical protein
VTARYALRAGPDGTLILVSKPRKRVAFAFGFLLLLGALAAGFDAATDLSAARAPLTVLYFVLLVSSLGGALSAKKTTVAPGVRHIPVRRTMAGLPFGREGIAVRPDAEVRITRSAGARAPYSLELWHPDGATVLDSSSWRGELEPMGRRIAATLGIPFTEALPASGGRDTVAPK